MPLARRPASSVSTSADVASAALIAREAGAAVTDVTGAEWKLGASSVLVAAPSLQREMLALLAQVS